VSPSVLVVATLSAGKRRELAALLGHLGLTLVDLSAFPEAPPVAEDADTYLANARAKAVAASRHTGLPALADDSGLEVDALGGAPGVRSARFAGEGASDDENVALLLERLRGVPDAARTARFRCVIVVARPDGGELVAEGTCEGRITTEARGRGGFGYDPVFFHPPSGATFAELDAEAKQRVSHRAAACRALEPQLLAFLSAATQRRGS
jgi:XTP/dITP diphosphohydrolase